MCRRKLTYYYDPRLYMTNAGYLVQIFTYDGKKSNLIRMYTDSDYRKVLTKAQEYVRNMTECQK